MQHLYRDSRQRRTILHMGCGCSGCVNEVQDRQDIYAIEAPKAGMNPVYIGVDSGAAGTVCPKEFAPPYELMGTPASKSGKYYLAANGSNIAIHGRSMSRA